VIPAEVRIFVCAAPVDMRFGFDRLAQVAREKIGQDPAAGGALFVFAGRSATRVKVLWFEATGCASCTNVFTGQCSRFRSGQMAARFSGSMPLRWGIC